MSESNSGPGGKHIVRDVMRRFGAPRGQGDDLFGDELPSEHPFSTREAIAELYEILRASGQDSSDYRRKLDCILADYESLRRQYRQLHKQLNGTEGQNEKLVSMLQEAKQQIDVLREEVDKLCAAPNTYAVFHQLNEDGTVEIIADGKPMRVNTHPAIDLSLLQRGQLVRLNEALNVIEPAGHSERGEVSKIVDFVDEDRAIVLGHTDDQRVVNIAASLKAIGLKVGDSILVDPRTQYATEKMPKSSVEEVVLEEVPNVTYDQIGGLGEQIEILRDSIELPYLYPEIFAEYKLSPPKGILLYGPPGCGKTLIAKAVARSLASGIEKRTGKGTSAYFLNVKGPELLNKYVGETEFKIREIFKKASEKANDDIPVVIFFDEMDSLFRQRGSGVSSDMEATVVAQFLSEIDGVESLKNVVVIGATNRQDLIDPAVLRPGRLDLKVKVNRPDRQAGREILGKYLTQDLPYHESAYEKYGDDKEKVVKGMIEDTIEEMYCTEDRNKFLEVTYAKGEREIFYFKDFASGAMIENIVARAKKMAVKRMIDHAEVGIRLSDLNEAVRDEFKENEDLPNTTNPDDWARISGKKGDRIINVRTLITGVGRKESSIETTIASGQYL